MADEVMQEVPAAARVLRYQWIPDGPDHRDAIFRAPLTAQMLPTHWDIVGIRNKIEDQYELGSCTGNAATSALEISIGTRRPFSRLMAYYSAREYRDSVSEDTGASIREVMKGLATRGVAYEETWPYLVHRFAERPSEQAYAEGRALLARMWGFDYIRVTSLDDLKAAIATGYPVTFGFSVPEWFASPRFNNILRFPSSREKIVGGHAVVAVGYDDRYRDKIVWVRNSWGPRWGIRGYFKMTQDWFTSPYRLADDMWVIRRKANPVRPAHLP
jgi:C1A family cysteine protease